LLTRILDRVPNALAHRIHILFLVALGIWLIVIPLIPGTEVIRPSEFAELIGGNWTNVSSALGACIAAGASLKAHSVVKEHKELAQRTHTLISELHSNKEK
jgi:hypothetical protein